MDNEKIIEFMNKIYTEMQQGFKDVRAEMQDGINGLRSEMQENNKELRTEMQELRREVRSEMQENNKELRTEMQDGLNGLRGEMQENNKELRVEMQELRGELRSEMQVGLNGLRGEMQEGFRRADEKTELLAVQTEMILAKIDSMEKDLKSTKECVVRIEADHGQKLGALFDGYAQVMHRLDVHEEKLDRIEARVSRHDEILIKGIK